MDCNTSRTQCTPGGVFAAVANTNCSQFFSPANFQAEQLVYDQAYRDLINGLGVEVYYYLNTFNLSGADLLYGEYPTSVYYGPIQMRMYLELTDNAIQLSKFGYDSSDEFTGYVHINTFKENISAAEFYVLDREGNFITIEDALGVYALNNLDLEPRSGDLVKVTALGCDRPNGRGPKVYEITERMDQDIATINPLLGHYVYRLRGKRYEYSFEPGAPQELGNNQVYENSFSGVLSTNIPESNVSEAKSYPGDIDGESKTKVLDMSVNNTDIYGTYY